MYTFRKYETIIANGFMCLYLIKGLNFYGCLLFLMATYFTLNLYLDFMNNVFIEIYRFCMISIL